MDKKKGCGTYFLSSPVYVEAYASAVGSKEGKGPLKDSFDIISSDNYFGEKSWELAETALVKLILAEAYKKSSRLPENTDLIFGGDLQKQCMATALGLRSSNIPFCGLYGACSTMAEGSALAAAMIDGGYAKCSAAISTSHFCTAEREYRMPLAYGNQRQPSAQWTVTGGGALILTSELPAGNTPMPRLTAFHVGRIKDMGIKDASNMGAAMAPAAFESLYSFFEDSETTPSDYDLIVTGDLGLIGRAIVNDLFENAGMPLGSCYNDCGAMIFDVKEQDVHAGGSGCGCSASVLCGHIFNAMKAGEYKKVIFAGTGALLSTTTVFQGESIPGICHIVLFEI